MARASSRPPSATRARGAASELGCLLHDLAAARARGGWRAAGRELRSWVYERVFRHGRLVVMEQDLEWVPEIPPPPGVQIRRLEPATAAGDWRALAELTGARGLRRFRNALDRGRVCLVAWRDDHAIGYAWLADRVEADVETFPVPLPPGVAYAGTLFVRVDERRRGVGSALVSARLREARARGHRRAWRVADPANQAALRTIEGGSGGRNRVVGTLLYAKLLGLAVGHFRPAWTATGATSPRASSIPP